MNIQLNDLYGFDTFGMEEEISAIKRSDRDKSGLDFLTYRERNRSVLKINDIIGLDSTDTNELDGGAIWAMMLQYLDLIE